MVLKLFTALIIIVAVVVGLLSITPFHLDVIRLAVFNEFFNAALPILGFGALVKFLCTCRKGCCCSAGKTCTK